MIAEAVAIASGLFERAGAAGVFRQRDPRGCLPIRHGSGSTPGQGSFILAYPISGGWRCFGAIDLQRRYQLSFWDAMIVRSAAECGCQIIWPEDLQHDQEYMDIRLVNPFLPG